MEKNLISKERNVETYVYTFDPDEVEVAEKSVVTYVNQHYAIPGFRKGKVPAGIVRNFLQEGFDEMVLENLSNILEEELKEEELYVPAVIIDQKREGDVGTIEVQLHRKPEIKIKELGDLELMIPKKEEVLLNYVNNRLDELRNENAIMEPKNAPVEIGDTVKIEYSIVKDGKTIANKKSQELNVAEDDDRPLVKNTIGKSKGDIIEFNRTFEGSDNEYFYTIKIEEVYKRALMDLDDEFARTIDPETESLEELKKTIEEEGTASFKSWQKDFLRQQAMDKIDAIMEIEVAESTVDYFVHRAIESSKKDKSYDAYLKQAGSVEKLVENFREGIEDELKKNLFLEEMAAMENIETNDEEIAVYAENSATQWGVSVEQAKELLNSREEVKQDIHAAIIRNKVLDIVVEKAKITEIEPDIEEEKEKKSENTETESNE